MRTGVTLFNTKDSLSRYGNETSFTSYALNTCKIFSFFRTGILNCIKKVGAWKEGYVFFDSESGWREVS